MESNLPATEMPHDHLRQRRREARIHIAHSRFGSGLGIAIVGFMLWHYRCASSPAHVWRANVWRYFAATVAMYVAGPGLVRMAMATAGGVLNLHAGRLRNSCATTSSACSPTCSCRVCSAVMRRARSTLGARAWQNGRGDRIGACRSRLRLVGLFWLAALIAITMNHGTLTPSVIDPIVAVGAVTFAGYLASPLIARLIHLTPRPVRRALGIIAPYLHQPCGGPARDSLVDDFPGVAGDLPVCSRARIGASSAAFDVSADRADIRRASPPAADAQWPGTARNRLPLSIRDGGDAAATTPLPWVCCSLPPMMVGGLFGGYRFRHDRSSNPAHTARHPMPVIELRLAFI